MSGLNNLNKRLEYRGGDTEGRLRKDKLVGLQRALFNSYQAETAILEDGREFKCLINPNKETTDYDNKIISIPFKDICLNKTPTEPQKTSQGVESLGIKVGDVFTWKENDSHWLIYLQYLEEDAYFRAQIRRCDQQIQINNKPYWVYIRGPVETSIVWNQKEGIEWNDLNYSLVMFITQDENTVDYFKRFTKIKVTKPGTNIQQTWQVVGTNAYYGDGIIQVFLDEYFENTIQEEQDKFQELNAPPIMPPPVVDMPRIDGPTAASVYDTLTFEAINFTDPVEDCSWFVIEGNKIYPMNEMSRVLKIDAISTGKLVIKYTGPNQEATLSVNINKF